VALRHILVVGLVLLPARHIAVGPDIGQVEVRRILAVAVVAAGLQHKAAPGQGILKEGAEGGASIAAAGCTGAAMGIVDHKIAAMVAPVAVGDSLAAAPKGMVTERQRRQRPGEMQEA